jgi:hypothetical protein
VTTNVDRHSLWTVALTILALHAGWADGHWTMVSTRRAVPEPVVTLAVTGPAEPERLCDLGA